MLITCYLETDFSLKNNEYVCFMWQRIVKVAANIHAQQTKVNKGKFQVTISELQGFIFLLYHYFFEMIGSYQNILE